MPVKIILSSAICLASLHAVDENGALRTGSGVRGAGIGAFSALDDDGTGINWNPATSVQLESPEISLALSFNERRSSSLGNPATRTAANDTAVALDHASFVWPFNAYGFQQTIGLIFQRQFDFGRSSSYSFSDDLSETHDQIEQDGSYSSIGISYAVEPWPGIGLGATVSTWRDSWTRASHYHQHLVAETIIPVIPIDQQDEFDLKTRVVNGSSAVLGAWARVTPDLALALVYRPGFTLTVAADEQHTQTFIGDPGGPTTAATPTFISRWHYPSSATMGFAWNASDSDIIAGDLTCTRWRELWVDSGGSRVSPVSLASDNEQFRDGVTASLGYERIIILDETTLAARIGLLYEELPGTSPSTDGTIPTTTDRYFGGSIGASLVSKWVTYDLAAQFRHGEHVGSNQDTSNDRSATVSMLAIEAGITVLLGQ